MTFPETLWEFEMRQKDAQATGKLTKAQSDDLKEWMAKDYGRAGD
jgi:hypothetical protein